VRGVRRTRLTAGCLAVISALASGLCLAGGVGAQPSTTACQKATIEAEFTVIPGSQGAGQIAYTLTIDNYGTNACTLAGLPALRLIGKHGANLPTHVITHSAGRYTIALAAGQYAQATATFTPDIAGAGEPGNHCEPVAHWLRTTLPAGGGTFLTPMNPTRVCQHGAMSFTRLTAISIEPNCTAAGISATFKAVASPFDGLVTYALVLANTSGAPCLINGTVSFLLESAAGAVLPTTIHSPLAYPYIVAAGQAATLDATGYTKPSGAEPTSGPCEPVTTRVSVDMPHAAAFDVALSPARSFCHDGALATTGLFRNG
jgi:hypothetical protein